MPRLSFLFRTDIHQSDNSPVSWKADYTEEIWNSLEQVGTLARRHEVNAVLDGGDYFHVKAPTKNSHYLVQKTASIHLGYPCPILFATGNHDVRYNNMDTLERQPLGTLYTSKVFEQLGERVFEDGDLRVRVVGVPYNPNLTLNELMSIQKKKGDTHLIAVIHALAALKPPPSVEDFWNEPVFSYESLVSRNGPDVFMFGHWHKDQGVEVVGGKHFINQGALSRGSLVRENLERIPKVALVEFDGSELRVETFKLEIFSCGPERFSWDSLSLKSPIRRFLSSLACLPKSPRSSTGSAGIEPVSPARTPFLPRYFTLSSSNAEADSQFFISVSAAWLILTISIRLFLLSPGRNC